MKKAMVLSRYNESVDWIQSVVSLFDEILIYNKGGDDFYIENTSTINTPNVGREGQTYLKYIIDNYDNLSDYILFCQSHPFDRGWHNNVNFFIENLKQINAKSSNLELMGIIGCETLEICAPHPHHHDNELKYKEEYEKIFECLYPGKLIYSSGATIWVSKQNILNRSKEFYLYLNEKMNKEIHPVFGWILERFWHTIFNPNIKDKICTII